MIDKLITSTLAALPAPSYRAVVKDNKKPKPETYIVFQYLNTAPTAHADDDYDKQEHTLRVHIFSKADYAQLLNETVTALKAAGFLISSIDNEMYEDDTAYYHRPITIYYLEELQCN